MCEPQHSIIQYPDHDPDSGEYREPLIRAAPISKIADWCKKVWGWLHFSKLGSGHSESLTMSPEAHNMLPRPAYYEGLWWDRTVRLDHGGRMDYGPMALDAAEQYCRSVVTGNLSMLRRFLETSIRKSNDPMAYVNHTIAYLLVPSARDKRRAEATACSIRLIKLLEQRSLSKSAPEPYPGHASALDTELNRLVKIVMGWTRHRELLTDAWSGDSSLWTPKPGLMLGKA